MSKKKVSPVAYSKREENTLLSIPFKQPGNTKIFNDLAKQWGRTGASVYQKHKALHESLNKTQKVAGVSGKRTKDIPAMTFTDIAWEPGRVRVNEEEIIAMQKGLDNAISGPLQQPMRGILFPARMMNRAKEYLKNKYKKNVFVFYAYKKDKKYKTLVKTV